MTVTNSNDFDWKGYPKRRRRNAIACAICYTPTDNPRGVCNECLNINEIGKRSVTLQKNSKVEDYWMEAYELQFSERIPGELKSNYWSLTSLVELLTGIPNSYDSYWHNFNWAYSQGKLLHKFSLHTDGTPIFEPNRSWTHLHLTKPQAEYLWKLVQLTQEKLKQEYQRGYRDGSSMINRLASGELTIDQLNKAAAFREKKDV